MFTLVINTAQKDSYVALYQESILLKKIFNKENDQSKELLPTIDKILLDNKLSLNDLGLIGVCIGPGTFTGTRIGVITAKTLAFAKKIPLIGFNSRENNPINYLLFSYSKNKIEEPKSLSVLYN